MSSPLGPNSSLGEVTARYPCEVHGCHVTCGRAADVKRHHTTKHGGPKTKCDIEGCDFEHTRPDKVKLHKLKEHTTPNDATSPSTAGGSSSLETYAFPYRPAAAEHQIAMQTPWTPRYYPSSLQISPVVQCACGGLQLTSPSANFFTAFTANQAGPIWPSNAGIQNTGMAFMDTTTQVQNNGYAALQSGYPAWNPFSPPLYPATSPIVLQYTPAEEPAEKVANYFLGLDSILENY
ncbi:hypothetical protein BP6252_01640 [Coleophoma cylindrospora]|uniref:C2H2-type domain-containing protein n=1 Tax=Coleophoma cylindrospora TaxID=1849047 RepID=A0A3D8SUZ5_9HELO|nr:hypothetical protein BP6252_01640 [Coleophoma cylindrospora]